MTNAFLESGDSFLNPRDFTDEIQRQTTKNLYELMAEAIAYERVNMLTKGESREYIRLLVPVFNKYATPAPVKTQTTDPLDAATMSELQSIYDNLLTRATLSRNTEQDSSNNSQSSEAQ